MSETCNHDCSSCASNCDERTEPNATDFLEKPHELSRIKRVIGVVSGKGGVGKSLVTSMLAVLVNRMGYKTAILDADVTGPSIPKAFGLHQKAQANELGLFPVISKTGISVISLNLLLKNETDPVVWRGPLIAGTVKQFWSEVIWGDVDVMFIDMPPGTGDVSLTVFQSLPVDGLIIVTSPQELVGMIVEKAVQMASLMDIPILGIVENFSYTVCPDCSHQYNLFGESKVNEIAAKYKVDAIAKLPLDPRFAAACDTGMIELFESNLLDDITQKIIDTIPHSESD
jgi:Mrp family chromosome partitioning ATPase